ncbi:uncharacterized protein K444DRAFT_638337 [Hyaloscypha bicolor E]|uniref:Uncharacterized protein n=1 Tax=Hyaloscypha bicolor E TaxID=1095630 RepID=A0A2J6SG37_9HELO|nr:uncharacterized protein K444DRAFT_638337 [Hyaloscypha bicolor E]PMD49710.1 hypothetical protein K444DRAFT_638337 [Hyaloscypha bicolor E]
MELVTKPDLAIPNSGFSEWNPESSTLRAGETNQQPTVATCAIELDFDFTLPGMIVEDLEHNTIFGRQELFIRNHENHIADLIRANNDLEQEIAALETSWLDISESHSFSGGVAAGSSLWAISALITIGATVLFPHKAVAANLQQRAEIQGKFSNAQSAFEKGRTELETAKKELECLQAARDLEADLPSLQYEVDKELDLAFQSMSL